MLRFSVVVPVYNEENTVIPAYSSLKDIMDDLSQSYEIIFVNDGSTDKSLARLKGISLDPSNFVIVDLDRHRGKCTALQAGFDIAKGESIITMDADLQNDPKDIPSLLNRMKDGYDVVCGWRYDRKDPWLKLFSSKVANMLRHALAKEKIHDVGCAFRVFRRQCLENISFSGNAHRFFTLIMSRLGYSVGEVKIKHRPRSFGKTKYGISNRLPAGLIYMTRILFFDINILMKKKAEYGIKEIIRT